MCNKYVDKTVYADLEIEILKSAYDYTFENEYAVNFSDTETSTDNYGWYEYLYGAL